MSGLQANLEHMAAPTKLRQQAEAEAVLRYAPQRASLQASLAQAIADRNSAIDAAATVYAGASGAIRRAGPQVRTVYRDARRSAAGADAVARKTLDGLASSAGVDTIKAAYAREGAVGGAVVAKALAARLADLSDRRIAAAAGRAFAVNRAASTYSAAAATNAAKQSDLAAQQGVFAQTRLGALENEEVGRQLQRDLQSQRLRSQSQLQTERLQSQAQLQSQRLDATAREGMRTRRNARSLARIRSSNAKPARGPGSLTQAQETDRLDAIGRIASVIESAPSVPVTKNGSVVGQRKPTEKEIRQSLLSGQSPIGRPVPADLINVAMELAQKGWLSAPNARVLQARGLRVPKAWQPTVVSPHLRRRPR